jgi:hypothetical protein
VELREIENGSKFLTSGQCSGQLNAASSGLDGRHGRHGSLASTGSGGRARERASVGGMW